MKIIRIEPNGNGAHNNQTINGPISVPDGWALIPDGMETPNFPFGDITVGNQYLCRNWIGGFDLIIVSFEIKLLRNEVRLWPQKRI